MKSTTLDSMPWDSFIPLNWRAALSKARLALAAWLWPKTLKEGDYFTITEILKLGQPTQDGSWRGMTLRADDVHAERIRFSEWSQYSGKFSPVNHVLIPGVNCRVKPVDAPKRVLS